MRSAALILITLVCSASQAWAKLPAPVAMDGPFDDPCAGLGNQDEVCTQVVRRKLDRVEVVLLLVAYPSTLRQRAGTWVMAVRLPSGWFQAHDPISIDPYWREHAAGHTQFVLPPRLTTLKLASGRPAVALEVAANVLLDHCNDVSIPPPPSIRRCEAKRDARARSFVPTWKRPVAPAIMACGQGDDGAWACIPPLQRLDTFRHSPRFQRDGSSVKPGDDGFRFDAEPDEHLVF